MLQRVPSQFLDVVPRLPESLFLRVPAAQFISSLCFHNLTTAFPANPLYSHPSASPGVSPPLLTVLAKPAVGSRKSCVFILVALLPLLFVLVSFKISNLQPLSPKYPRWSRLSESKAPRTMDVRTLFRSSRPASLARMSPRDAPAQSLTQRGRIPHIQLSLLQAQGSQVYG
jgi:hypothetical protein